MDHGSKVALIVGGSCDIGRQIAIDLARDGYACIVAGKYISDAYEAKPFPPNSNIPQSTINTVVHEIQEAGGKASAVHVDTQHLDSVQAMIAHTIELYGGLDVLVYNSAAVSWSSMHNTPMKRFQHLQRVNVEGLYGVMQASLPEFRKNRNRGRIIIISPPIYSRFCRGKTAYAMGKIGMSVLAKGLAMDFVREGKTDMAVTSMWPASAIESVATADVDRSQLREATILSDAILAMLKAPAEQVNGRCELDEDFLRLGCGVTDFDRYSLVPGALPRTTMPANLPDVVVPEQADRCLWEGSNQPRLSKI